MGTNFYRVITLAEAEAKKEKMIDRINDLELTPGNIQNEFRISGTSIFEEVNPWTEFNKEMIVHLGKRSGGWRFLWNFHDYEHYSNKRTLHQFIRSGRIVDEYGDEMKPDDFIKMATEWCPDGHVFNNKYIQAHYVRSGLSWKSTDYDSELDGLRISAATEFS